MIDFAHLLGKKTSRRMEEDNPDNQEVDDEKDPLQGRKRGRRIEEPGDQDNNTNDDNIDDGDNPDKQGRKAKKSRAKARRIDEDDPDAEGEDDDGDDMIDDPDDKEARMEERQRCARIFGSTHAAGNPALAASLAFNTGMSSAAAIQVMASTGSSASTQPAPRRMNLDERMRQENIPKLKQETPNAGGISAIVAQYKKLNGRGN